MKILALDIETSGAVVRTFGLRNQFHTIDAILEHPRIICWSAKWVGSGKVMFKSEYHDSRDEMLREMWNLLNEADAVLTYNGARFDLPWLAGEMMLEGLPPFSPVRHIDLYQAISRSTRHISGKLDYAVQRLLGERKIAHQGMSLWNGVCAGDEKAWALMKKYAMKDTALLEPLYERLKPWIPNHPNVNLYDGGDGCPRCGHAYVEKRGYAYTSIARYQQYHCLNEACGKWFRGKTALATTETR